MDARIGNSLARAIRTFGGAALIAVLGVTLLSGCAELMRPAAKNETAKPSEPKDPPLIVKKQEPPPSPADAALGNRLQQYISQMESAPRHKGTAESKLAADETHVVDAGARPFSSTQSKSGVSRGELVTPVVDNRGVESELPLRSASVGGSEKVRLTPSAVPAAGTVSPGPPAPLALPAEPPPQPPKLLGATARAATPSISPVGVTSANATPNMNGAVSATPSATPASLIELAARWQADGDESSFGRQLDARVMYVVAGDYEKARAPLTLVSDQQRELALRYIESLIAIRDGRSANETAATTALTEIERLADTLRDSGELSIPVLAICREVRGFGQYTPISPAEFPSGEPIEFVSYLEIREYRSEKQADGAYLTQFEMRTKVLNRSGDTVVDLHDPVIEDRCKNKRRDCFVPRLVSLPASLSPGEYVLKTTVVDKLGAKVAETSTPFRILPKRRN